MVRRIPPRLVDPLQDNARAERALMDLATSGQVRGDVRRVNRDGLPKPRKIPDLAGGILDGTAVRNLIRILAGLGMVNDLTRLDGLIEPGLDLLQNHAVSDSTVTFGTTLTTIVSTSVGPLLPGVKYRLLCLVHTRLSVDSTGFARAFARTQAGSSSVSGERTGTVDGERSCNAWASEVVWGAGSSVTMSARANMDTSTGFSSSALVVGLAYPIGRA